MRENQELDWKKYEAITKYIYETLGQKSGVKIECFGGNCKVTGKSEVNHQIDVLTSHSDGIHIYRTAIECKYWNEKINKDIIMKVSEIIEDAGVHKGVIVSRRGFTEDGISFAKYKNIGLVELREVEEKDFDGKPRVFDIKSWLVRPEILNIVIDAIDKKENETETIVIDQVTIEQNNGEKIPFVDYIETFKKELRQEKEFAIVTKGYKVTGGNLINNQTNTSTKIKGIIFTGVLTKTDVNLGFKPVDQIWLIMKTLFEESTFYISEKGVITKHD